MILKKLIFTLVALTISNTLLFAKIETHNRFLGKEDAPVTIYEFGSLACHYCADFDATIMPKIVKDYIDTGKVKYVFLDVPFGNEVNLFAHSVLYQTKTNEDFFKLLSVYYKNQAKLQSIDDVKVYAKLMGISDKDLDFALNNKEFKDEFIKKAQKNLQDLKVEGTPTVFFVKTGQPLTASSVKLVGVPSYDAVQREIDRLLKK
ncbi:MAG: DsbA family protein [Alphaproteobacteria bacterium]|nr:DsbA family protein [Alphaproteobacteria bacterium]